MTRKLDIVPIQSQNEKRTVHSQLKKQSPQKLIVRLMGVNSVLFIYEGIREEMLRVLLSELSTHEDR